MTAEPSSSSSNFNGGGCGERGDDGSTTMNLSMTEYCGQLENWLWRAYYQRTAATSAYFTALNWHYCASQSASSTLGSSSYWTGQGQQQQGPANGPPPGPGVGMGPVPAANQNNVPNINNNYLAPGQVPQQQQQPAPRVVFNNNVPQAHRQPILMFLAAAGFGQRNNAAAGGGVGVGVGNPPTVSTAVVVRLAPVWKRFMAELIDFLFLLLVKLFITFTVIDSFELIDLDNIDLESLRAEAAGAADGDSVQMQNLYDLAFSLTSELLLLELTHRIVVCFFEAYCLWKAGATPGKTLLGLRVVHADDVLPFNAAGRNNNNVNNQQQPMAWHLGGPGAVIVRPGSFLSFPRALLRSALKNFSLACFFPLCFTLFHFDHSRTLYDLMAHSIVVEVP